MRILDDTLLRDCYDVVVIGSGLAGLTAAALIAKRGLSVLVVEHHYLPGGMCTTLRRRGFSFDTGTGLLYGFGERGVNPHRFVMNELGADIDIIEHRALLRMRLPDKQITFWPDYEQFVAELAAAFPTQADQVRALYAYLHHLYTDVIAHRQMVVPPSDIPPVENLKTLLRHPIAMLQALRMLNTSAETVLSRYITDPDLMAFFDKLTSTYIYCTAAETPAILAATMFIDNHVGGAYYPARSPQILASTLEKALEDYGGQALYGRRADEIIIEDGTATGVRLSDGTIIRARQVVANVTVWNLYAKLIRPQHVSSARREWARRLIPTYASVVLYIGVAAEAIPAGTLPVEMLIADVKGVNSGDVTLYISSLDDPSICPPGTHAITVIAPSDQQWPAPTDPAYRSQAYKTQKRAAAEKILTQIEGHFPGLRQHIQILEIATPATIERYTLKNGGAVGGPRQSIGQELMKRLHTRSAWKNLYLCGDSTEMGMGTPAVTISGVGAANCVLRDAGLPDYRRRAFERDAVRLVAGKPLPPLPAPTSAIDDNAAVRLARECEYCEHPGCTHACPARIDIRNVMRRLEARNFAGAARLLRETNPLAEVCGHLCGPNPPCEAHCNRRGFSDRPVRIADLESWTAQRAGVAGWPPAPSANGPPIAVLGAGPAGLTCAYFLARAGRAVSLMDREETAGATLLHLDAAALPPAAAPRDLHGILGAGIAFASGVRLPETISLRDLSERYAAIYLAAGPASNIGHASLGLKEIRQGVWSANPFFAGGGLMRGPCSTIQAVADGRRAAQAILNALQSPAGDDSDAPMP